MIEGLKLALKHCTNYEDRMYLSFLIRVELSKDNPVMGLTRLYDY